MHDYIRLNDDTNMGTTRSSRKYYEIIVSYMEKHGDVIAKRNRTLIEKIENNKKWDQIMDLLDKKCEEDGELNKSKEQWRKAWLSLKNYTLKKFNRLLSENGNHIETFDMLSNIEQRIYKIAMSHESDPALCYKTTQEESFEDSMRSHENQDSNSGCAPLAPASNDNPTVPLPPMVKAEIVMSPKIERNENETSELWDMSGIDEVCGSPSPSKSSSVCEPLPLQEHTSQNTSRRRRSDAEASAAFSVKRHRTEEVLESSCSTDDEWRKFFIEKGQKDMELERERLRLKEIELKVQSQWQEVAVKAIDTLYKVINSKFKD